MAFVQRRNYSNFKPLNDDSSDEKEAEITEKNESSFDPNAPDPHVEPEEFKRM